MGELSHSLVPRIMTSEEGVCFFVPLKTLWQRTKHFLICYSSESHLHAHSPKTSICTKTCTHSQILRIYHISSPQQKTITTQNARGFSKHWRISNSTACKVPRVGGGRETHVMERSFGGRERERETGNGENGARSMAGERKPNNRRPVPRSVSRRSTRKRRRVTSIHLFINPNIKRIWVTLAGR